MDNPLRSTTETIGCALQGRDVELNSLQLAQQYSPADGRSQDRGPSYHDRCIGLWEDSHCRNNPRKSPFDYSFPL